MEGMRSIEELFPSKHLAAIDLRGSALDVTIVSVEEQVEVGTNKEKKPALLFAEAPSNPDNSKKWFIANKTNCKAIAQMYGVYPKAWVGKRITIYPTEVAFGGETRMAIRVKTTPPMLPAQTQQYVQQPMIQNYVPPAQNGQQPAAVGGGVG